MIKEREPVFRCYVKKNARFISIKTASGNGLIRSDYRGVETLLDPNADDLALGNAVLAALAKSRYIFPEEDMELYDWAKSNERYETWVAGLMTSYGYKTRGALFKSMLSCSIDVSKGQMTIRPSKHVGGEAWDSTLRGEQDHVHLPADSTPEEIGAALRLALSRCV